MPRSCGIPRRDGRRTSTCSTAAVRWKSNERLRCRPCPPARPLGTRNHPRLRAARQIFNPPRHPSSFDPAMTRLANPKLRQQYACLACCRTWPQEDCFLNQIQTWPDCPWQSSQYANLAWTSPPPFEDLPAPRASGTDRATASTINCAQVTPTSAGGYDLKQFHAPGRIVYSSWLR